MSSLTSGFLEKAVLWSGRLENTLSDSGEMLLRSGFPFIRPHKHSWLLSDSLLVELGGLVFLGLSDCCLRSA